MTTQPVEVLGPIGADLKTGRAESGDGEIAADAARLIEHQGVGDRSDALVDVVGSQPLQQVDRTGTADFVAGQRCHVVEGDAFTRPLRLGDRDGRPVACRPVVTLGKRHIAPGELPNKLGIGLEPCGSLPAAALVEVGAQFALAVVEWAGAQAAQRAAVLVGMNDVVDLDEGLRADLVDESWAARKVLEPVQVAFVHVDRRGAVDDPLRDRFGHPGRMGHPHRLGNPESAQLPVLAEQRIPVGREREDAVEALVNLGVPERRQQSHAFTPGRFEVLLGEGEHRGHRFTGGVGQQRGHVHGHRLVPVGADAKAVDVFAKIKVGVLVAQDRQARRGVFGVAPDQRCDLAGLGVLVRHRHQRQHQAHLFGQLCAPESRRADHDVGLDDTATGVDSGDPAVVVGHLLHLSLGQEDRAPRDRAPSLRFDRAYRRGQAVARGVKAAQDSRAVQQRVQLDALVRADQPPRHSPGLRPTRLAMQVRPALGGGGDLEPAHPVEHRPIAMVQSGEFVHGVASECAHGFRRVGRKHQAGGMRRGSAGGEQGPAVDHRDIDDPPGGQLVGQRSPNDAGTHDDDLRSHNATHLHYVP